MSAKQACRRQTSVRRLASRSSNCLKATLSMAQRPLKSTKVSFKRWSKLASRPALSTSLSSRRRREQDQATVMAREAWRDSNKYHSIYPQSSADAKKPQRKQMKVPLRRRNSCKDPKPSRRKRCRSTSSSRLLKHRMPMEDRTLARMLNLLSSTCARTLVLRAE